MIPALLTLMVLTPICGLAAEHYIWPRADVQAVIAALRSYEIAVDDQRDMHIAQGAEQIATTLERLAPVVTPRLSGDDEAQLAELINQFQGNQASYLKIIDLLRRLGLDSEATRFERLTAGQAAWLLHAVGDLAQGWSEIQDEAAHDGHEDDFVYAIPGVRRPLLDDYLRKSLGRLAFIAQRYAAPLVLFLRQVDPESLDARVEDWQSLLVGLAQYEQQDAASPMIVIERFLNEGIGQLTQSNCAGQLRRLGNSIDGESFFANYQWRVIERARDFCRATRDGGT